MKKQYALDEIIDLFTQAKTHLERGDQAAASLAARQAESARLDAAIDAAQKALASVEAEYHSKASALETVHAKRMTDLDARAAQREAEIDAAAAERLATHQRVVRELQQRAEQLKADIAALVEQHRQAERLLDAVQAVLAKTKAEAQAFSTLLK